ncbi:MAG: tRNA (N6-threonylcarbamoyladenosine(37)-N6)-methyltransferase TrmO [Clostridia bacterium]|nr:tRNA (N6-threonylcarbamoyladenosine(37)-N6)-methyltransferase TrmO [Clostridia bacterium]MBQ6718336.1 tRNA (N6-threonylcarbamoyladenosine(37)-N6)-methyltransferase TrmO [Clostridia bacterium]
MEIKPIAYIKTDFKEKFGIPRQSGIVEEIKGEIIFEKQYQNPDALRGIEEFSHLWLIFDFSKNHREGFFPTVRPPRLGGNTHIGVFATRSPFRPNNLGLSCVKLKGIKNSEKHGKTLIVSGVDLLDNTPIFDIKPYIPYSDCKPTAKGSFSENFKDYKIKVLYDEKVFENIDEILKISIIKLIEQNPKPAYKDDKKQYKFLFSDYEICFEISEDTARILKIDKI